MPFVIAREGPVEPKEINPLTAEQKEALWEHVVRAWCLKNPERLMEAVNPSKGVSA